MDNTVALVQAYLRVNGYFTVAEYPVIEAIEYGKYLRHAQFKDRALGFLVTLEKVRREAG